MDTPFDGAFNERRLFQHLKVLRDRGLCGIELAAEFAGASRASSRKSVNYRTAGAVGQGVKYAI